MTQEVGLSIGVVAKPILASARVAAVCLGSEKTSSPRSCTNLSAAFRWIYNQKRFSNPHSHLQRQTHHIRTPISTIILDENIHRRRIQLDVASANPEASFIWDEKRWQIFLLKHKLKLRGPLYGPGEKQRWLSRLSVSLNKSKESPSMTDDIPVQMNNTLQVERSTGTSMLSKRKMLM